MVKFSASASESSHRARRGTHRVSTRLIAAATSLVLVGAASVAGWQVGHAGHGSERAVIAAPRPPIGVTARAQPDALGRTPVRLDTDGQMPITPVLCDGAFTQCVALDQVVTASGHGSATSISSDVLPSLQVP